MSYIAEARDAGAEMVLGGKRLERDGHFVEPTLLTNVGPTMRVFRDEIFGPVLSVIRFSDASDLDAIAAAANDTDYGLAAKIWTRDLAAAHGLARRIQAGSITVNGGARADACHSADSSNQDRPGRRQGRNAFLYRSEINFDRLLMGDGERAATSARAASRSGPGRRPATLPRCSQKEIP